MNKQQQTEFVNRLGHAIITNIIEKIEGGEVPDNWDGVELREYMALCFSRQTLKMRKHEKAAFNNTIEVTNL